MCTYHPSDMHLVNRVLLFTTLVKPVRGRCFCELKANTEAELEMEWEDIATTTMAHAQVCGSICTHILNGIPLGTHSIPLSSNARNMFRNTGSATQLCIRTREHTLNGERCTR